MEEYYAIAPYVELAGPRSLAPIIEQATGCACGRKCWSLSLVVAWFVGGGGGGSGTEHVPHAGGAHSWYVHG